MILVVDCIWRKPLSTYATVFTLMASVISVNIVFLVGCSGSHCGRYAPFQTLNYNVFSMVKSEHSTFIDMKMFLNLETRSWCHIPAYESGIFSRRRICCHSDMRVCLCSMTFNIRAVSRCGTALYCQPFVRVGY